MKIYVEKHKEVDSKNPLGKETDPQGLEGSSTSEISTHGVELLNEELDASIEILSPPIQQNHKIQSGLKLEFHETHKDTQEDLLAIQETFVPDFNKSSQSNDDYALSSSDSELVDATQTDNGQEEDVGNKLTSNVQHDMEFLK